MQYPIGIQTFDQLRKNGYVYVDKTALIYQLVTTGKAYVLNRPRHFGKSLLVSTLEDYYCGRKELFEGLAIADLEQDWLKYPVFKMDFNSDTFASSGVLEDKIESYITKWEVIYGKDAWNITIGDRLKSVIERAYQQTGRRAVILIDEYDKPILDTLNTQQELTNYRILEALYSTFKRTDAFLQFVLLTGVTKVSQLSPFGGFDQLNNISLHPRYATLCGITEQEMECYFSEPIVAFSEKYKCSIEEAKSILRQQYGSYHFSDELIDVFNPFSLLKAFEQIPIINYWYKTDIPVYLKKMLTYNVEQINKLTGKYYLPVMFMDYRANVEKALSIMYQSGYLTIKDYNLRRNSYLLDFPNDEIRQEFFVNFKVMEKSKRL